jgi:ubiquinone/menaquinone biosynthesis C-methylase UbiE
MSAAVTSMPDSATGCVICGAPAIHGGDEIPGTVRCRACGLALRRDEDGVWLAAGEPARVEYPETGAELMMKVEDASFWFQHRNLVLSALLDAHAPGATLVDVGGGNGFQALHLQRAGRSVVMVEPGAAGCRNAARRGVRNVVRANLEALELASGTVPAVSLLDVVEHLPDPSLLLAESHRVLRPGGKLLVTVPAYRALWSDEDVYAQHQRRYTKARLRR